MASVARRHRSNKPSAASMLHMHLQVQLGKSPAQKTPTPATKAGTRSATSNGSASKITRTAASMKISSFFLAALDQIRDLDHFRPNVVQPPQLWQPVWPRISSQCSKTAHHAFGGEGWRPFGKVFSRYIVAVLLSQSCRVTVEVRDNDYVPCERLPFDTGP